LTNGERMAKFEIKGNADKIIKVLDDFVKEVEKEWDSQVEWAKKKMKGKLSALPVKMNLDIPPLILTHMKKDENTVIMFSNIGGTGKGISSKFVNIIYKPAKKKMVKNLEGYLKANGLDVKVRLLKEN